MYDRWRISFESSHATGIGTSWKRPGYEHRHQDSRHCLGDDGDLLLLPIRVALSAVGDDAAVIRGFRSQFDWAWPRSWGCSTTDTRHSVLSLALRWTASDRGGFSRCRGCGRRRRAAVRDRPQRSGERGQSTAGSRGSLCPGGSHLHRHQKLSAVAGRHFDRRYPDVRDGRRIGGAVCGWANDRCGIAWDRFWIGMGVIGLAMGALLFAFPPEAKENRAARQWVKKHQRRVSTPYSRIRNRYCAA